MYNHKKIVLAIAVLLLIGACQRAGILDQLKQEKEVVESSPAAIIDQAARTPALNYAEYCSGCHGIKMDAFVDRAWKHGKTDQDLYKAIKFGYEDEGMPAYEVTFSERELEELVDFIQEGIANVDEYDFENRKNKSNVYPSEELTVALDTVSTGVDVPWGLTFLPNGDLLITERSGKIYRQSNTELTELTGAPDVVSGGQGGMLDIELHPNHETNGWIYIAYSQRNPDKRRESATSVLRAKLTGDEFTDHEVIFTALPYSSKKLHFGSRLEFDRDGYLYVSVGDRFNRDVNPQNLDNHCGKIHRINDDGSIPDDNPFVNTEGAMPSIFSYGHRNPQGVAMHPETGVIWSHEHGPRGGDEINIIQESKNYGWPVVSYGINYNGTTFTEKTQQEGMEDPVMYWLPSIGVCGMSFVKSDLYPGWKNNLLSGSLRFKYLERAVIEGDKVVHTEKLLPNIGRLRTVEVGPDGYIYVAVEDPGYVFRLLPQSKTSSTPE